MKHFRIAVASAFVALSAFFSGGANAAITTWDTVLPAGVSFSVTTAGDYSFSTAIASGFGNGALLFSGVGVGGTLLNSALSFSGAATFDETLAVGTYYTYLVGALFPSTSTPTALVTISGPGTVTPLLSAVPEPETYALLLAGLAVIGFAARRRKTATGTAAPSNFSLTAA